jgi:hypothetical protein
MTKLQPFSLSLHQVPRIVENMEVISTFQTAKLEHWLAPKTENLAEIASRLSHIPLLTYLLKEHSRRLKAFKAVIECPLVFDRLECWKLMVFYELITGRDIDTLKTIPTSELYLDDAILWIVDYFDGVVPYSPDLIVKKP